MLLRGGFVLGLDPSGMPLHSGMDVKTYAASAGRPRQTVSNEVLAARVSSSVPDIGHDLSKLFSQLVEIHVAPRWLWSALVEKLVALHNTFWLASFERCLSDV